MDTRHATQRGFEREITRPKILYVLKDRIHELQRTVDELDLVWNYAIRGKTVDKKNVRVAVSLDENGLLIITAIVLDK